MNEALNCVSSVNLSFCLCLHATHTHQRFMVQALADIWYVDVMQLSLPLSP